MNRFFYAISLLIIISCNEGNKTLPAVPVEKQEAITYTITCADDSFISNPLQCNPDLSPAVLDVVTWNIENVPMHSNSVEMVADIIQNLGADIYAIQEIDELDAFNTLISLLDGYDGIAYDVRGGIELGFIYKSSEISSVSDPIELFDGQTSPFPREPIEIDITHVNGLLVKLINIHLKCCDGSEDRRTEASKKLKTYIDDNFSEEEVIVLGDWNETFEAGSSFTNFLEDFDNYIFADMPISMGSGDNYSYPCTGASYCPSHIDHILITNELCDNLISSNTIRLDDCIENYLTLVSDHRPVMISLKADN